MHYYAAVFLANKLARRIFCATGLALFFLSTKGIAQVGSHDGLYRFDNPQSNFSYFGQSISSLNDLDNDGIPELLIGNPLASSGGKTNNGSAYVFSGAGGNVIHQIDGARSDNWCGNAVAAAGDVDQDGYEDFIVGSFQGNTYSGEVEVFFGANGSRLHHLLGLGYMAQFGYSVAGGEDVDGDSVPDIVVGAPQVNGPAGARVGSVAVYSGTSGSLIFENIGQNHLAYLGTSVAFGGDFNGDGTIDILAGEPGSAVSGWPRSGAVYVYSGVDGSQLHVYAGRVGRAYFGSSLASAGDVNADGFDDMIVGAPFSNSSGISDTGYATVISGGDGKLLYLFEGALEGDLFGDSVAGAGDTNGDGFDDFIIGAPGVEINGKFECGAAYLYSGLTGELLSKFFGENRNDNFGICVAGCGDFDFDGKAEIAVSGWGMELPGAVFAGSVIVYSNDSFNPILSSNHSTLSSSQGGQVDFNLDFPLSQAGLNYLLLASYSGAGPWNFLGMDIPLTYDLLTQKMRYSPLSLFHQTGGVLDASGDGVAWLQAPPGALSSYVGSRMWLAVVSYDPAVSLNYTSVAVTLDITP
jgi:hypothetical protein